VEQRQWKPVLVPSHPAENGSLGGEASARSSGATAEDEGRRTDIRFAIGTALALGLPTLIGVAAYLVVITILRL
jgi:hypothetical protein